jgi:uncharacterized protein (DUF58 family)
MKATAFEPKRPPERPGPGPLPETLLRALEIDVRRRMEGLLAGDHRSAVLGVGTELAQVRPYQVGDDVRQIDWNVTARTGEAHVRVQIAERVLVTWLVLDLSPSMAFGTADRRKADVAEGVALAVAHVASRRGNRVGVVAFGDGPTRTIAPRQGRVGMLGTLLALRGLPKLPPGRPASLADALGWTAAVSKQRAAVLVVSDFRGPHDWRNELLRLAGHHEVLAVEIRDPREQELPSVGELWLVDPESGRLVKVDTSNSRLRQRFASAAASERDDVAAVLRKIGVRHVVLSTSGDWLRTLAGFLRHHGARA